jgi:NADH dehydrogenase
MPAAEPRIVIVGGGFGGLFTALELARAGSVTLISDEDHFLFTPMLYEYLSGEVEEWHIAPKYSELLDEKIRSVQGAVANIDLTQKRVTVQASGEQVEYDILVLAVGGVTNYAGVPGAEEFAIPFRKIAHADLLRSRMVSALDHRSPYLCSTRSSHRTKPSPLN